MTSPPCTPPRLRRPTTDEASTCKTTPRDVKTLSRVVVLKRCREERENEEQDDMTSRASLINSLLRSVHEGAAPKFTPSELEKFGNGGAGYGGITGTISPGNVCRVLRVMISGIDESRTDQPCVIPEEYRVVPNKSVFCDVGCGTGRPVLYAAANLPLRASLGFDIDPLQVFNSCAGWRLTASRVSGLCPVAFVVGDMTKMSSLFPATHVYAFVGYEQFVFDLARLACQTPSVRMLTLIVLRESELQKCGLWDPSETDVVCLRGMRMPAGNSYFAAVFPITKERRNRVLNLLLPTPGKNKNSQKIQNNDVSEAFTASQTPQGRVQIQEKGLSILGVKPAKRKAAERASKAWC